MIQHFTLNEFKDLAKEARRIAVFKEVPINQLTPLSIYHILHQFYKTDGVILEDLHQGNCSRYSYIGFESIDSLQINNEDAIHPLTALRHFQSQQTYVTRPEVAELITTIIGFITYDAIRYFEEIPDRHPSDPSLPILFFNAYATNLTVDHAKKTILISTIVEVDDQSEQVYIQVQQKIQTIIKLLSTEAHTQDVYIEKKTIAEVEVDRSDSDFIEMVEKAKKYILRGDAFQIVLSRCFMQSYSVSPLAIYKTLRQVSPSPFMFYFPTNSGVFIGASPERMIRVHHQQVTVNPIAGTRKTTEASTNEAIAAALLNDKKELAEHMMLVDLARNDVGMVSEPASVHVSELLHVKHYSHISHITSTVTGKLQEKYDAFDAFAAAFPAGTLSGAPKIRAMQLIDELEVSRRGLYGGAICRLDSLGNFDSCIAIRMARLKDGIATIRTGAGIVYDSNPTAEAEETRQKAQSILDAIAQAHGE